MSKKSRISVVGYPDVLDTLKNEQKVHVLLGNGFSRACREDIFAYGSLFERAKSCRARGFLADRPRFRVLDFRPVVALLLAANSANRHEQ